MKANIGSSDKLIRLGLAIVLIILFYKGVFNETVGIIGLLIALLLTTTSLLNFCPLYTIFKINTTKKKEESK